MQEHNRGEQVLQALRRGAGRRGAGETLAEMQRLGLAPGHDPVLPEPTATAPRPFEPVPPPGAAPTVTTGRAFEPAGPDAWDYRHTERSSERLWTRIFWHRPASEYLGRIELTADVEMQVRFSLGRHGGTPWEGVGTVVTLTAGRRQALQLRHRFEQRHAGLRVQIEVLDVPPVDQARLQMHSAFVCRRCGRAARTPICAYAGPTR
jgi:hypothetical protein